MASLPISPSTRGNLLPQNPTICRSPRLLKILTPSCSPTLVPLKPGAPHLPLPAPQLAIATALSFAAQLSVRPSRPCASTTPPRHPSPQAAPMLCSESLSFALVVIGIPYSVTQYPLSCTPLPQAPSILPLARPNLPVPPLPHDRRPGLFSSTTAFANTPPRSLLLHGLAALRIPRLLLPARQLLIFSPAPSHTTSVRP